MARHVQDVTNECQGAYGVINGYLGPKWLVTRRGSLDEGVRHKYLMGCKAHSRSCLYGKRCQRLLPYVSKATTGLTRRNVF